MNKGTEEQNRKAFNDWFSGLLFKVESCLLRDVLRANKDHLWKTWMEVKPWNFEDSDVKP